MVASMRKWFNENFTEAKYKAYLEEMNALHPGKLDFRVAETPVFVDKAFTQKMLSACESIVDVITQYNFKSITAHSLPAFLLTVVPVRHGHFRRSQNRMQ